MSKGFEKWTWLKDCRMTEPFDMFPSARTNEAGSLGIGTADISDQAQTNVVFSVSSSCPGMIVNLLFSHCFCNNSCLLSIILVLVYSLLLHTWHNIPYWMLKLVNTYYLAVLQRLTPVRGTLGRTYPSPSFIIYCNSDQSLLQNEVLLAATELCMPVDGGEFPPQIKSLVIFITFMINSFW